MPDAAGGVRDTPLSSVKMHPPRVCATVSAYTARMSSIWRNRNLAASMFVSALAVLSACAPAAPLPTATFSPPTATPKATASPAPAPNATPRLTIDTPDWFDNALIYEIFPRSFADSTGDGIGDLPGITARLDYINSLGANTLWLTPHYPSNTYHGYTITDYKAVHPEFGTLEDFKNLTAAAKQRNMRVLVDFVANHTSTEHPFFKDAYKNPASKYSSWFNFSDAGNTTYTSFFGINELPEWNHDNPAVVEYLLDAALFWLDQGADGLRCDYAPGVPFAFWRALRERVKARHPDTVLLAEVFDGNPLKIAPYFSNGFDAAFDFPYFFAASGGGDANGDGIVNGISNPPSIRSPFRLMNTLYPVGAQLVRFASNHDTNRVASEVNGDPARMRLAAAMSILTPGTPMIYYGEEIGMRGTKGGGPVYDELRREPMDWFAAESGAGMTYWFKPANRNNKPGDGVSVEEQDGKPDSLLSFYRQLGGMRGAHAALRSRDFAFLESVPGCEQKCVALWRWSSDELIGLAFNFSDAPVTITLDPAAAPISGSPGQVEALIGAMTGTSAKLKAWGILTMRWVRQ